MTTTEPTITALRIDHDATTTLFTYTRSTALDTLQHHLGGYLEAVPATDQITFYADEEGLLKYTGDHLNFTASTAIARFRGASQPILGPVIAVGAVDENGDETSLTPEQITYLTRLAQEQADQLR